MTENDLPLIIATVAVITKAFKHLLPGDWLPVVAVLTGILCVTAIALGDGRAPTGEEIKLAITGALAAMGAYSGIKAISHVPLRDGRGRFRSAKKSG